MTTTDGGRVTSTVGMFYGRARGAELGNVINTARDALRLADDMGADNVSIQPGHLRHEHRGGRPCPHRPRRRRPTRPGPHRGEPPRLPRLRTPGPAGLLPRIGRHPLHETHRL